MQAPSGFYNINKQADHTSSDVVVRIRGILRSIYGERPKVGHLGTLDPAATGVLPIAVGSAVKLFDYLLTKRKTYIATFRFGITTDTLDATGTITDTGSEVTDPTVMSQAIGTLVGTYPQYPPMYSAKSIDGHRAYDLARKGIEVALPPKQITVYSMELLSTAGSTCQVSITCSAGTYIRSLCRDMATAMGTVGVMTSLLRTRSGSFDIQDSVLLDDVRANPGAGFLSLLDYARTLPVYTLAEDLRAKIDNGIPHYLSDMVEPLYLLVVGDTPYGIATYQQKLKIVCRL